MNEPPQIRMDDIASTMAETETMWTHVCSNVEPQRVEMLIQAMVEQHGLIMHGESNADAIMALAGFIADQVIAIHESGDMSIESAMVLLQIGMQRGVQAHVSMKAQMGAS